VILLLLPSISVPPLPQFQLFLCSSLIVAADDDDDDYAGDYAPAVSLFVTTANGSGIPSSSFYIRPAAVVVVVAAAAAAAAAVAVAVAVAVAAADVIWEDVGDPISFGEPLEFLLRVIHH